LPTPLSFPKRLRLAWELTWPLSLADLAVIVVLHGALNVEGQTLDTIWALVLLFVISPFVVRRALARPAPEWHIVSVSRGVEGERLTYQQSFKVMWLLAWRTIPLGLAVLLVVSALFRATGASLGNISAQDPLVNNGALTLFDTVTSMLLYPLLIPGMLKKRYRGFHLELRGKI
jgi:hypothetical protein